MLRRVFARDVCSKRTNNFTSTPRSIDTHRLRNHRRFTQGLSHRYSYYDPSYRPSDQSRDNADGFESWSYAGRSQQPIEAEEEDPVHGEPVVTEEKNVEKPEEAYRLSQEKGAEREPHSASGNEKLQDHVDRHLKADKQSSKVASQPKLENAAVLDKNAADTSVYESVLIPNGPRTTRSEHVSGSVTGCDTIVHNCPVTTYSIISMTQTLRNLHSLGLADDTPQVTKSLRIPSSKSISRPSVAERRLLSRKLRLRFRDRRSNPKYSFFERQRMALPIQQPQHRKDILRQIKENDVTILVSETGSGKSTQLPQMILEKAIVQGNGAFCNIACTQPRRLAAISVARRVAQEQATTIGDHVGFHVRFSPAIPKRDGSITYFTAGVFLRLCDPIHEDVLDQFSHVIIDEVHERDLTTDFLLNVLRDKLHSRKQKGLRNPKVILMSATIDARAFRDYFETKLTDFAPTVNIFELRGRNYGVQRHMLNEFLPQLRAHDGDARLQQLLMSDEKLLLQELKFSERRAKLSDEEKQKDRFSRSVLSLSSTEDLDDEGMLELVKLEGTIPGATIAATAAHIVKTASPGDILVFLPGLGEIRHLEEKLREQRILGIDFNDASKFRIFRLHASLYETNDRVFEPLPKGCRRIILSTNIAQTSITLGDVVHVIDAGKQRRMKYNPSKRYNEFLCAWTEKATLAQRSGRAGRTQPGHYWAMFTEARYQALADKAIPEARLVELSSASLLAKHIEKTVSLEQFYHKLLDPPDEAIVQSAVNELKSLQMLQQDESMTPLGNFAAFFPIPPSLARGLLYGLLFHCFEPFLIMASHSPDKPLIYSVESMGGQMEASVGFAGVSDDDRHSYVAAFQDYDQAVFDNSSEAVQHLQQQHVKEDAYQVMCNIGRQLYEELVKHRLVPPATTSSSVFRQIPEHLNENSDSADFVKALSLSLNQNRLAVFRGDQKGWFAKNMKVFVRPISVNSRDGLRSGGRLLFDRSDGELLAYAHMTSTAGQDGSLMPRLTETSRITPLMAMLFGPPIEIIDEDIIQLDGWLKYRITAMKDASTDLTAAQVARLIVEFRKAIERFLKLSFMDVANINAMPDWFYTMQVADHGREFNSMFQNNSLTDLMRRELRMLFERDAASWDEYTHLSQDALDASIKRVIKMDRSKESRYKSIQRQNVKKNKSTEDDHVQQNINEKTA